jgi:hypothetical protein
MTQILVSLAILTLWALTSLLSREAQPLPPRTTRGLGPDGPRPAPAFAGGDHLGGNSGRPAGARAASGMTDSRFPSRSPESTLSARSAAQRTTRSSDEIRILDSDPRSSRPTAGGSGTSAAAAARTARNPTRRGSRVRPATSASNAKSIEPSRQRALTNQVNLSMAEAMGRPYEGIQLAAPLTSLSSSLSSGGKVSSEHDKRALPPGPGMDVDAIRVMLASPSRLREIAFLSELLKPPLALRPRSRLR